MRRGTNNINKIKFFIEKNNNKINKFKETQT